MVREHKLKPLLLEHTRPLEQLGRDLIAAANAAGGRDNITVILFTLEEVDAPSQQRRRHAAASLADEDTSEYNTFTGEAVAEPRQGVSRPQGRTRRWDEMETAGATRASDEAEAEYRASGTVALSAVRPRAQPIEEGHAARHPPPSRAGGAGDCSRRASSSRSDASSASWRPSGSRRARSTSSASTNPAATSSPSTTAFRTTFRSGSGSTRPVRHSGVTLQSRPAPRAARPSPTTSCAPRTTPRAS